jgi:hypothetical protein
VEDKSAFIEQQNMIIQNLMQIKQLEEDIRTAKAEAERERLNPPTPKTAEASVDQVVGTLESNVKASFPVTKISSEKV